MKKLFIALTLISCCLGVGLFYNTADAKIVVTNKSTNTISVKGKTNPTTGGVSLIFTAVWDGLDLYVLGTGGHKLDEPIRAIRTTEYSGWPYYIYFQGKKYYLKVE